MKRALTSLVFFAFAGYLFSVSLVVIDHSVERAHHALHGHHITTV